MGATIARATGIEAELIEAGQGIFDVAVDGKIIYSKYRTGEFPAEEHIVALLRAQGG